MYDSTWLFDDMLYIITKWLLAFPPLPSPPLPSVTLRGVGAIVLISRRLDRVKMSLAAVDVVFGRGRRVPRELRVTSLEFWGNICLVRSARQRLRQRPESQGRNPRPPRHGEFEVISGSVLGIQLKDEV